ncbi:hypothetical protein QJQ45_022536, partial [Haematococcus lacustris]
APPEDGYIRTLSADACLQPSSYAGAARATRQPCDIRGIVGFVCCHGIAVPQLFCNMRTPEQFVDYLLALAGLVHMCFGLVLHVYIDFACQFKVTWARYARVVGLDSARAHLMVNSMHGASHDVGCQLKNNGRYLATAAWRVGEQTEQLWSMFKAMSPLLRYMTRANRADAVQARLSAIAFNKQAVMLAALEKQHKSMLKKEDETLARKAFVVAYVTPKACSVRPNDWWLVRLATWAWITHDSNMVMYVIACIAYVQAVWMQLFLEVKALEAVAFGLSLEAG